MRAAEVARGPEHMPAPGLQGQCASCDGGAGCARASMGVRGPCGPRAAATRRLVIFASWKRRQSRTTPRHGVGWAGVERRQLGGEPRRELIPASHERRTVVVRRRMRECRLVFAARGSARAVVVETRQEPPADNSGRLCALDDDVSILAAGPSSVAVPVVP